MVDTSQSIPSKIVAREYNDVAAQYESLHEEVNDLSDNLLSHKNLIHVHGVVGLLPWQIGGTTHRPRNYGQQIESEHLRKLGESLMLADDELSLQSTQLEMLHDADVVAFLGFGFHEENLKRIHFDKLTSNRNRRIYATSYKLEPEKCQMLKSHRVIFFDEPLLKFIDRFMNELRMPNEISISAQKAALRHSQKPRVIRN